MKIGIFTYGTRGDLQPYVALALGLIDNGHQVVISATEDFKEFVEGFGISFTPLYGNSEEIMNSPEGQQILKTENPIKLMKYYFKVLHDTRKPLRESYFDAISNVDFVIANAMTLPIVATISEKLNKKYALTYFMPPIVPTKEFPVSEFDVFNFPSYNRLTYKLAHAIFWLIVKKDTNEYREELGLPVLKENLISYVNKQEVLDLYCISKTLIPQPKDWDDNHKITGFINVPSSKRDEHFMDKTPAGLDEWLQAGKEPIYMGFGSNGIGNTEHFSSIILEVLNKTDERILFCTGWSVFDNLPKHKNLFTSKYVNHESIFPKCKLGIFHGGAGTLSTMLRNNLPVVIISFYTDQPTWGKIVEQKNIGIHIPVKKATADKLISAIKAVQTTEIKSNVLAVGKEIRNDNGLENAINEIEEYFSK